MVFDKEALADAYFSLFDELYNTYNNNDTRILLAPCWAHGASEAFLRRVRDKADERGGVMIHMHLLQSPVQKAYGFRWHGKPTVFSLDDLGLVQSNVVYGHAIHVTEAEIALMGRRNVSVTSLRAATSKCATASPRSCRYARPGSMSRWGLMTRPSMMTRMR